MLSSTSEPGSLPTLDDPTKSQYCFRLLSSTTLQLLISAAHVALAVLIFINFRTLISSTQTISEAQNKTQALITALASLRNSSSGQTLLTLSQQQNLIANLNRLSQQQNDSLSRAIQSIAQQQQYLQSLQSLHQTANVISSSQNMSQFGVLNSLSALQPSFLQSTNQILRGVSDMTANISSSIQTQTSLSIQNSLISDLSQNASLSKIVSDISSPSALLLQTLQSTTNNVQFVNSTISTIGSTLNTSRYVDSSIKNATAPCRTSFLSSNMVSTSLGQGCFWHSGSTNFTLTNQNVSLSGLVANANMTFSFRCTGGLTITLSVASTETNWFTIPAVCDGSTKSTSVLASGLIGFPASSTVIASIAWGYCGQYDITISFPSMCVRIDWP
jgi:hypothetical protein